MMATDLIQPSAGKFIMRVSIPILCSIIINSFWLSSDVFFLGKVGEPMISIATSLSPCLILAYSIIDGFSIPLTVLTGRYIGAGDACGYSRIRDTGFLLIFGASFTLSLIAYILLPKFSAYLTGNEPSIKNAFESYAFCFILSLVPWCLRAYQTALCAGAGHTMPSYISSVVFVGSKLAIQLSGWKLDELDVKLIGCGTVCAMWISVAATYLYARYLGVDIVPRLSRLIDRNALSNILFLAAPIMAGNLLGSAEAGITLAYFRGYGPKILAALSLVERFRTNILFIAIAAGAGLSIFVSQNYGAKQLDRVWEGIRWTFWRLGIGYVALSIVSYLTVDQALLLLAPDSIASREFAAQIIRAELLCYPFLAFGFVGQGAFGGIGKTYPNMVTLAGVVLFGRLFPYLILLPKMGPPALRLILPWSHMLHSIEAIWLICYFYRLRMRERTVMTLRVAHA